MYCIIFYMSAITFFKFNLYFSTSIVFIQFDIILTGYMFILRKPNIAM